MKKIFSIAVLFFAALAAVGQGLHVGVTTGVNTTLLLDNGLSEDPRYNSTLTMATSPIGLNVGYDLTPGFGISLESILSNQEMIYEIVDVANQIRGGQEIDLQYVHLPLLLNFMNGSNAATRFNFSLGSQLSVLTAAVESYYVEAGNYKIPDGTSFADIQASYPSATQDGEQAASGEYTIPSDINSTELLSREADDFRNTEFQIAGAMGLSIDLSKHLVLSTLMRVNYRISDMTNEDAFNLILENNASQLFAEKAQLTLGLQLGVHYSFGLTRSHRE